MEKFFYVEKIFPLRKISVKERNGEIKDISALGFVLACGKDKLCAEAFGDMADALHDEGLKEGSLVWMAVELYTREWKSERGNSGFSNEARITFVRTGQKTFKPY